MAGFKEGLDIINSSTPIQFLRTAAEATRLLKTTHAASNREDLKIACDSYGHQSFTFNIQAIFYNSSPHLLAVIINGSNVLIFRT